MHRYFTCKSLWWGVVSWHWNANTTTAKICTNFPLHSTCTRSQLIIASTAHCNLYNTDTYWLYISTCRLYTNRINYSNQMYHTQYIIIIVTAHLDLERRLWERGDGDLWALRFDLLDSYRSWEWLLFLFLSSLLLPDVLDLVVTGDTCAGATGTLLAGSESLCSPNSVMNSTWPSGSELEEGELDRLLITKTFFLYTD